jgi:hypothetical protein
MPRRPPTTGQGRKNMPSLHTFIPIPGFIVPKKIALTLVYLVVSRAAFAQSSIDVHFGLRGGAINNGAPIEAFNNHYFPTQYYPESAPYTLGPTVGVLLDDRFEIRLEAVRSRFSFRSESGSPFPWSGSKWTSQVDGSTWQFPLVGAYHFGTGPVRVFGGGGISLGTNSKGTAHTETTTVPPYPPYEPAVTTNSVSKFRSHSNPLAIYVTGGINNRVKFLSIRPEFRYTRWTSYRADYENSILFSLNQFEVSISLSLHPFPFKSGDGH